MSNETLLAAAAGACALAKLRWLPLACMACLAWAPARAEEVRHCASTISELRSLTGDPSFPLRWVETSMRDEKPLVVSITERDGTLFLEFRKTREGLWAQGRALVCAADGALEARIAKERIELGPAANWLLRQWMAQGGRFVLTRPGGGQLRIDTRGWGGSFAANDR